MNNYQFFATTPKNMESLLAEELRALGAENVSEARAGASFSGTLETACRACLWSRVANRVLLVLSQFPAETPEALYTGVQAIDWRRHFDVSNAFAVAFSSSQSEIHHTQFGALKTKDAIVDQFRDRCGERPSIRTEQPDIQINVYLLRNQATLSLDLSGDSLHKRGYRETGVPAPLKENLAAAILLRAGWPDIAAHGGVLVDPMCGSGTLLIEAAFIAADIAPGLQRKYWGFSQWKQHDTAVWQGLLDDAHARRAQGLKRLPDIRGYDQHHTAVRIAVANIERAGLSGHVHVEKCELANATPARPTDNGLVVANPPYGERLGTEQELQPLYAQIGTTLKQNFHGWRAAIITSNTELGKAIGIRARRMHTLYNGAIECKLLHFDVTEEWFMATDKGPQPLPADRRSESAQMFANRLQKNIKHLGKWARREHIRCYRIYDADLPEYALAVDLYQGPDDKPGRWVHVQEYEAPKSIDARKARKRLREALGVIMDVMDVGNDQLFFKVRKQQKGKAQYEKLGSERHFHEVLENDCRFLVNFEDYLDTGLFLDHRITRQLLAELAGGKDFLNLFAYTGTASVYAAKGGAISTTTIDMSRTYMDWAKRNMAINGFRDNAHEYTQANCLEWLDNYRDKKRFGLIFLDPPSFSSSKRMEGTFDVQRDHVALIKKAIRLLTPDGLLIFSTNMQRFKLDTAALADLMIEDISRSTLPPDFERNPKIHHCWKLHRQ